MAAETAIETLARLLGASRDEAEQQLDRFAGGMTAELLERKRLSIDGLGLFSVVHQQAVREKTSSGTRYLPPGNRVVFDARKERAGDAERVATGRLEMEAHDARRFVKALVDMFEAVKSGSGRLELRGFGSFTMVSGQFHFQPEASLEALLNIAYDGLKEIVIPESRSAMEAKPLSDEPEGINKVVVFVATVSLLACGWFLYRQFSPGVFESLSGSRSPVTDTPAPVALNASLPSAVPETGSAAPDSLMLQKGRYTVVAATFSSMKGARGEMLRLSERGLRVWFWPVRDDGKRYYRLVLGDFETWQAALDSMKAMPRGLSRNFYIQQASKNVVLYGEQGL
jgi:nucleoid DNA-binding protein